MLRGTDLGARAEGFLTRTNFLSFRHEVEVGFCRDRRDLPVQIRASCVIEQPLPLSLAGVSSRSIDRAPAEEAPRAWSDRHFLLRRWPRRAWGT